MLLDFGDAVVVKVEGVICGVYITGFLIGDDVAGHAVRVVVLVGRGLNLTFRKPVLRLGLQHAVAVQIVVVIKPRDQLDGVARHTFVNSRHGAIRRIVIVACDGAIQVRDLRLFAVCRVSVGAGAILGGRGSQAIPVIISVAGAATKLQNRHLRSLKIVASTLPPFDRPIA